MAFPSQSAGVTGTESFMISNAAATGLSETGDITVEAWVKWTTLASGAADSILISKWVSGTVSFIFRFVLAGGVVKFELASGGGGNVDVAPLSAFTTGTWYHVAWVYDSVTRKYEAFVNGVSQGVSAAGTALAAGTNDYQIGAVNSSSNQWDGRILLLRYWTVKRTASQILNNMCNTLGTQTSLGAEWTFDNTVNDNSGNGNTLTNVNSATFSADIPATCATVAAVLPFKSLMGVGI